jgi:3-oxoacyl-[acyl-carrier-protein] synthase-3
MPARITAVGGYVPPDVISNQDLSQRCGKTASWIRDRTGIDERRWAAPGVPTSDLALYAVEDLARRAPAVLDGVSMILLATSTPDRPQPATAAILGRKLGLDGVPACDINSEKSSWSLPTNTPTSSNRPTPPPSRYSGTARVR